MSLGHLYQRFKTLVFSIVCSKHTHTQRSLHIFIQEISKSVFMMKIRLRIFGQMIILLVRHTFRKRKFTIWQVKCPFLKN